MKTLRAIAGFLVLAAATSAASAQEKTLPIGSGELKTLSANVEKVGLRGAGQVQQLAITGQYANGGIRDLTRQVKYRVADPKIARVEAGGLLSSVTNGTTEVIAVTEGPDSGRMLLTNGHPMSSTAGFSQRYMRALAHIPLLSIDNPERVLVMCFGVGNTADRKSVV